MADISLKISVRFTYILIFCIPSFFSIYMFGKCNNFIKFLLFCFSLTHLTLQNAVGNICNAILHTNSAFCTIN